MSNVPFPRESEAIIQAARIEANEFEENLREGFFGEFHLTDQLRNSEFYLGSASYSALLKELIAEKDGKTISESFDIALSPKYVGKISVVELGLAIAPFRAGCIDHLVDEYRELRSRLAAEGIIDDEASRDESQRSIVVSSPEDEELRKHRVIVTRLRPLIRGTVTTDETPLRFGIAKRAVYTIPTGLHVAIKNRCSQYGTDYVEVFEDLLDKNSRSIDAVRVGYYMLIDEDIPMTLETLEDHTEHIEQATRSRSLLKNLGRTVVRSLPFSGKK